MMTLLYFENLIAMVSNKMNVMMNFLLTMFCCVDRVDRDVKTTTKILAHFSFFSLKTTFDSSNRVDSTKQKVLVL